MSEGPKLRTGDVVRLKKAHPCGTNAWEIMQLGMDAKLRCRGCGKVVRLPRRKFERRVRGVVEDEAPESASE